MVAIDMEMPKNCVECNHMDLQQAINCQLIYSGCANCGRHPNCPLVEIEERKVEKHTVQITIYGETHSVRKIIHKYVTMDEYRDILREYYNPNRGNIHVYLTRQWYSYENDIFYIDVYTL